MVAPADWKEIKVGDYAHITTGKKNTQDRMADGKYPFFVRSQNVERINSYSYDGEAVLTAGDGVGTGKVFHYVNGKFDCHQRVYRITDFRSDLNGKFFYLLFSRLFYDRIMSMTAKSSVDSVRMEMISEMELVVPSSIREQELIAEALSDSDTAIDSLDALIAKKRDVKQAAMQQLLTGRTRLPGFTADWKEVRLGEICEFVKTIALSRSQLEADHGVGCIHYGDIHTKFNDRLDCSNIRLPMAESGMVVGVPRLKVGDLVIADASEDMNGVGKGIEILGIPEYGVVAGLHTAVLRPQAGHFAKGFLGQLQHMPKFREQARVLASGLKVYGLSKTSISKISVEIPPLKEQEAIAEVLSAMDDELEALTEQVSKLRMVKEGMMQDLLTGKVRLV